MRITPALLTSPSSCPNASSALLDGASDCSRIPDVGTHCNGSAAPDSSSIRAVAVGQGAIQVRSDDGCPFLAEGPCYATPDTPPGSGDENDSILKNHRPPHPKFLKHGFGHDAAIDSQVGPGNPSRCVGGEKETCVGDIIRVPHTSRAAMLRASDRLHQAKPPRGLGARSDPVKRY